MKLATVVLCACLLCGCSIGDNPIDPAMELRNTLLESSGCEFTSVISADYGDKVYTFQMDCAVDSQGSLTFTVSDPETIRGISGVITPDGSSLRFDDKVLAFPLLANDQLTPVSTPWIFWNSLKGGYISGCSQDSNETCIYLDDSFENAILRVEIITDTENIPIHTSILWNQKQILSADIRNFKFL